MEQHFKTDDNVSDLHYNKLIYDHHNQPELLSFGKCPDCLNLIDTGPSLCLLMLLLCLFTSASGLLSPIQQTASC